VADPPRPTRPSDTRRAERAAAKLTKSPRIEFKLRITEKSHTAIKVAAAEARKPMLRMILEALVDKGIKIDPADLADE
jgi:hypothetical protein